VIEMANHIEGVTDFKVTSEHYNHYTQAIALLAGRGFKAYRFSVAWTQSYPDGHSEINETGIEFYTTLIDELLFDNIEPILTMYHFDLAYGLEKEGGWSNRKTVDDFEQYAETLFTHFGDRVKYWLTINEQNMMILHGSSIGTSSQDEQ